MLANDSRDGLSVRRLNPGNFPMSQAQSFADFLRRIRRGDEQAAMELVQRYESLIRREVRLGISDRRLNRAFDSIDVCQSVLASFFARAATGQYDLESPEQLVKLLMSMARNKLASLARREHRLRRDARRVAATQPEVLEQVADSAASPSEIVLRRELVDRMRAELTADERQIADLRVEGLGWEDVAQRLGGSAQARRMQLARGIERAAEQLGLEE
jgi:RNA polymerase sigma factor (sigma-70 family)